MPFVSFEGIDGSGKSTQAARLTSWLRRTGFQVTATGEPGGGRLGRAVRAGLTETGPGRLSAMEEFLLVSASRYDHVRGVVLPALSRGEWVVCDRYVDSTFAFQVYRQDVPRELFEAVTSAVTAGAMPDFTFVLDLDPLEAEGRRAQGRRAVERPQRGHEGFRNGKARSPGGGQAGSRTMPSHRRGTGRGQRGPRDRPGPGPGVTAGRPPLQCKPASPGAGCPSPASPRRRNTSARFRSDSWTRSGPSRCASGSRPRILST